MARPLFSRIVNEVTNHDAYFRDNIDCTGKKAFPRNYVIRDHGPNPFILLKVVASQYLLIWHAFFGVAGLTIDITVLYQSPLFNDLKTGQAPKIPFVANNVTYPWGYYLVDGIYPELMTLIKTISKPTDDDNKRILYKLKQESARKYVERVFGVLKKKWVILANPAQALKKQRIIKMMYTCIILHNIIRKFKRVAISPTWFPEEAHQPYDLERSAEQVRQVMRHVRSAQAHQNLRVDLVEHVKFINKLKYLKEKIDIWARLHKESLNSRKSILKAALADLDGVIDKGEGSDVDGHRRREVVWLIQEVEKVDAMEVAQKAKIKWSIEGDENSKYCHGVLNKKRGRLTIHEVLVDGIWMESPDLVKHEFFEHFKNTFEKPNKSRILLEMDFVKRIYLKQNDDLEREVSNEEIKRAVWDCGIDKAPGPDGFTFGFYRCLIGSLYKVIAKVLANRLVTVLDDIVDEIQSAFVTDRQILDGPFILNEIVHWCKNKKKQSMIFKVDFEKAYDSVRWNFIDDILRRFRFGEKLYKWIQSFTYGFGSCKWKSYEGVSISQRFKTE
nr:protein ALP1-like [Tanacetum cinerariifolium]